MEQILEQFPIVIQSLNVGFLQTLKLFAVTLLGAIPLGLIISFGSMSRFRPLRYFTRIIVWTVSYTHLCHVQRAHDPEYHLYTADQGK